MAELTGEPNYSTVRTQLRVLEEKGHVQHETEGTRVRVHADRFPGMPCGSRRSSIWWKHFFGGSPEEKFWLRSSATRVRGFRKRNSNDSHN